MSGLLRRSVAVLSRDLHKQVFSHRDRVLGEEQKRKEAEALKQVEHEERQRLESVEVEAALQTAEELGLNEASKEVIAKNLGLYRARQKLKGTKTTRFQAWMIYVSKHMKKEYVNDGKWDLARIAFDFETLNEETEAAVEQILAEKRAERKKIEEELGPEKVSLARKHGHGARRRSAVFDEMRELLNKPAGRLDPEEYSERKEMLKEAKEKRLKAFNRSSWGIYIRKKLPVAKAEADARVAEGTLPEKERTNWILRRVGEMYRAEPDYKPRTKQDHDKARLESFIRQGRFDKRRVLPRKV